MGIKYSSVAEVPFAGLIGNNVVNDFITSTWLGKKHLNKIQWNAWMEYNNYCELLCKSNCSNLLSIKTGEKYNK